MTARVAPRTAQRAPFRLFSPLLLFVLGGYLFFDRAFAWVHVPGIPVFLGEVVLAVGVYEALRHGRVAAVVRRSAPLKVLAALMAVGLLGLAWGLPEHRLDAVRDSAIWYYGGYAILTAVALAADPGLRARALGAYRRVLPWFLLWAPAAVVLFRLFLSSGPKIPDSDTSVVAFKPGDIAVHAAIALAYLWLAEERPTSRLPTRTVVLSAMGLVAVLFAGSQNRGGLLAALVILVLTAVFVRHRGRLAYTMLVTLGVVLVVALALDLRVDLGEREVSVQQMLANAESIVGGEAQEGSELEGTVAWRLELWGSVLDDVVYGDLWATGWGFGINIGEVYGVAGESEQPLRNAHNSHLTVLARMGIAGIVLWGLLWIVWFGAVSSRITPRHDVLPGSDAAQAAWALAAVAGMLVNAVFDPTLEGPQVAVWFWVLVGFGAAIAARLARPRRLGRAA